MFFSDRGRARRRVLAAALAVLATPLVIAADPVRASVPEGIITGVAGDGTGRYGGDGGPALLASLSAPSGIVRAGDGNLFIADTGNHRIRRVDPTGTISTVAGTGSAGFSGDGGAATAAQLRSPEAVALDDGGNLYIADTGNARVRRVDTAGTIATLAGTGTKGFSGDGGAAAAARLGAPGGLAIGPDGSLYVSDTTNHRVRRIDGHGTITTVVGNGVSGSSGDGGPATSAGIRSPRGLAFDADGNLFIAEAGGHRIRRVDAAGVISTRAGNGEPGYTGDGGPAAMARLAGPRAVAVDAAGVLYVADTDNHVIRMVTPEGAIFTAAGFGSPSFDNGEGDGWYAIHAPLTAPRHVTVDPAGDLYIADTGHDRIRKVTGPQPAPPGPPVEQVRAAAETEPVAGTGDAADDPAIWIHPADPSRSLIIGTDKASDSLEVWDLAGQRVQRLADANGSVNAVDVRRGFRLGGELVDLAVSGGSDVGIYRVDPTTRQLLDVRARIIRPVHGAHGLCLYQSRVSGRFYAFALAGNGMVQQLELFDAGNGTVDVRSVRGPWDVGPDDSTGIRDGEIEACVADDETGSFYVAEQDVGLWRYGAEPTAPVSRQDRVMTGGTAPFNGGPLYPDVEGIAVVHAPGGASYLIASSQGDSSFSVFRGEAPYEFVRKFRVSDGPTADGCIRTDGIEAVAADLGPAFPPGVVICQDHENTAPGATGTQNFKLVPLEHVVPLGVSGGGPDPDPEPGPQPVPDPDPGSQPVPDPGPTPDPDPAPRPDPTPDPPTSPPFQTADAGTRSGYWMLGERGRVFVFGDAAHHGEPASQIRYPATAVDLEPTPSGKGYWILDSTGTVFPYGDASALGDVGPGRLHPGETATSLSATPTGKGYWLFTSSGRAVAVGDAVHLGDMSAVRLNGPVLDSIATPSGRGYYMVASDGGIFAFGDARFFGSMGSARLNAPIQSLVPDPDGIGYWLVASDGGVFAFEGAFRGSLGAVRLNALMTGMVPFGNGYLMVGADGGIFNFSDKPFLGSLGGSPPADPISSVAAQSR